MTPIPPLAPKRIPSASTTSSLRLSDSSDEETVESAQASQQEYRTMQSDMQAMLTRLQDASLAAEEDVSDFAEAEDKVASLVQLLAQCKVDGHTLRPTSVVCDTDPLMTRIEVLRQTVEATLGFPRFKAVYTCLNNMSRDDDEDDMQQLAVGLLSEEHVGFLPLIMQLIFCEDEINIRANRRHTE